MKGRSLQIFAFLQVLHEALEAVESRSVMAKYTAVINLFSYQQEEKKMRTQPHILVIFGSTRQARRGEVVINWLMDRLALRSDASFELVDLRDISLPFFNSPNLPVYGQIVPEAERWAAQVERADGFIFVAPEYN